MLQYVCFTANAPASTRSLLVKWQAARMLCPPKQRGMCQLLAGHIGGHGLRHSVVQDRAWRHRVAGDRAWLDDACDSGHGAAAHSPQRWFELHHAR